MKTAFHLNEVDRLKPTLSNIKNILKMDVAAVILLINGNAINLFKEEDFSISIADPRFKIFACKNSMETYGVNINQLQLGTEVVASGVYSLSELQLVDHFAYIKA